MLAHVRPTSRTDVTAWTLSALVAALLPLIALTVHRTRRTNVAEVQAA